MHQTWTLCLWLVSRAVVLLLHPLWTFLFWLQWYSPKMESKACDPSNRRAHPPDSIGGIPEFKTSSPKKLAYPSPKNKVTHQISGHDLKNKSEVHVYSSPKKLAYPKSLDRLRYPCDGFLRSRASIWWLTWFLGLWNFCPKSDNSGSSAETLSPVIPELVGDRRRDGLDALIWSYKKEQMDSYYGYDKGGQFLFDFKSALLDIVQYNWASNFTKYIHSYIDAGNILVINKWTACRIVNSNLINLFI